MRSTSVICQEITATRGIFDHRGKKSEITSQAARDLDKKNKTPYYQFLVRVRRLGEARPGPGVKLKIVTAFRRRHQKDRVSGTARAAGPRSAEPAPARSNTPGSIPDNVFLIDRDLSNNSYTVKASMAGTLRWTGKLLFWIQNLLQFAAALS